jgi:hypothetical protein
MNRRTMTRTAVAIFLASLTTTVAAAEGSGTLDAVARAMGGKDRLAAVRTLVMDGVGDNFNLGQNLTPNAELPRFEVDHHRRRIDFANRRWLVDQMRTPRFATGNLTPQR